MHTLILYLSIFLLPAFAAAQPGDTIHATVHQNKEHFSVSFTAETATGISFLLDGSCNGNPLYYVYTDTGAGWVLLYDHVNVPIMDCGLSQSFPCKTISGVIKEKLSAGRRYRIEIPVTGKVLRSGAFQF